MDGFWGSRHDVDRTWSKLIALPETIDPRSMSIATDHEWVGGSTSGGPADLDRVPNTAVDVEGNVMLATLMKATSGQWTRASFPRTVGAVLEIRECGASLLARTPYEAFFSKDSGIHWDAIRLPRLRNSSQDSTPTTLSCLDQEHLWVSYSNGELMLKQGEQSWVPAKKEFIAGGAFSKFSFITEQKGVGLANGGLWVTEDRGRTWTRLELKEDVLDFSLAPSGAVDFITSSSLQEAKF